MKHILEALEHRAKVSSTLIALSYKDNQKWHYYRWQDVLRIAKLIGAGLLSCELEPGDRVGIISNTRVEWMLSDLGCMTARLISVPVYPNLSPEETAYIINDSGCKLLILENETQVNNWKSIKEQCPNVKSVIVISNNDQLDEDIYSWNSLLQRGGLFQSDRPNWYLESLQNLTSECVATIPYTSGTTGKPKGVVLRHRQLISELEDLFAIVPVDERDTSLCFLPQSHIMGRVETLGSIYAGYRVAFAESMDLFRKNIAEVKPTFLIAVPRVFEKIHTAILLKLNQSPLAAKPIKKFIGFGKAIIESVEKRNPIPLGLSIPNLTLKYLLGGKIKEVFGGKLRFAISGGAPLSQDIAEFFFSIGIPLYEGYGLTETTASISLNSPLKYKLGTVGQALGDAEIKISEKDGEILVKSDKVMKEYYNNQEATDEVFSDGYFHTGDIGEFDEEGYLKITDRKKDLIKTAGGKYVVPQKLSRFLQKEPLISQSLIIGDQQRYIVALISLDAETLKAFAKEHSIAVDSYEDLTKSKKVHQHIKSAIANANAELASFETIKKFYIVPQDFTVEGGELTPSMKKKRRVIEEKYAAEINKLYGR